MSDSVPFAAGPRLTRRAVLAAAALAVPGAAGAQTATDLRFAAEQLSLPTTRQPMTVDLVKPRAPGRRPAVIVLHERTGPASAFRALAQRIALENMIGVLPDMMSAFGIAPDTAGDARDAYNKTPAADFTTLLQLVVDQLPRMADCNGAVGVLAFQWGGSVTFPLLAQVGRLRAAVLFDLSVDKPERWQGITVPVQLHVPEQDSQLMGQSDNNEKKLMGLGKPYEQYLYPGMLSSFALESSARRYNKDAADLAVDRAMQFLKRRLGAV